MEEGVCVEEGAVERRRGWRGWRDVERRKDVQRRRSRCSEKEARGRW